MAKKITDDTTEGRIRNILKGIIDSDVSSFGNNLVESDIVIESVPTGMPSLDSICTGHGFPDRGIVILAGAESTGKTALALRVGSMFEGDIAYIDSEYTTTSSWVERVGCDPKRVKPYRVSTIEEACEVIKAIAPFYKVIIWDSMQNSSSGEQLAKTADQRTRATSALVMSTQAPIINAILVQNGTLGIFISHLIQNQKKVTDYDPEFIMPGAQRLKHNSRLTLLLTRVRNSNFYKSNDKDYVTSAMHFNGQDVKIKSEKNKVGSKPFRTAVLPFLYEGGYSAELDTIRTAIRVGVIDQKGAWYSYEGSKIGQGVDNVMLFIRDNPDLGSEIYKKVLNKLKHYDCDKEEE